MQASHVQSRSFKFPHIPMRVREAIAGYLFVSPWVLGFIIFMVGPMIATVYLSFHRWDLIGEPRYVGWQNYERLFDFERDKLFWKSLKVTIMYGAGRVPLGIITGLFTAILLNQKVRFLSFWRVVYYMPVVLPPVAISLVWMWIYNPRYGMLNLLLESVGLKGQLWLDDVNLVLPSLMVMAVWSAAGRNMIIYLSGLQGISEELYEAAAIDGAGTWSRFRRITLPMLTPVIFFNLITGLIETFQLFTQAYVMTEGGPQNQSRFFAYHLWHTAFNRMRVGYASAMAMIVFVIVILLTLLVFRWSKAWVYYEGELAGGRS